MEIDEDNNGFFDYSADNTFTYTERCSEWLAEPYEIKF